MTLSGAESILGMESSRSPQGHCRVAYTHCFHFSPEAHPLFMRAVVFSGDGTPLSPEASIQG